MLKLSFPKLACNISDNAADYIKDSEKSYHRERWELLISPIVTDIFYFSSI